MIIRIMNENQYIVPSLYYDDINKIDSELMKLMAKGDKEGFQKKYGELISIVRKNGVAIDHRTLKESDLIIPPADATFKEAQKIFADEGLVQQ